MVFLFIFKKLDMIVHAWNLSHKDNSNSNNTAVICSLISVSQIWRACGAYKPTSVFASVDLELALWELGVLLLPSTPGDDGFGGRSLPSTGLLTYFVLLRLSSLPAPNNLSFSCSLQIQISQRYKGRVFYPIQSSNGFWL